MVRAIEYFWRFLPAVRRPERSRALFFTALLTVVMGAQTVGLAGSEALFLARLSARELPLAFVIASLAAVGGSSIYAVIVGRARNDALYAWMLLGAGALLAAVPFAVPDPGPSGLFALIAAYYLTHCVFSNHFWTFAGDYFDTLTSKRLVPVFALGSSLGGLLGGVLGALVAREVGPLATIGLWGSVLCAAALLLALARRPLRRWGPLEEEEADETSVAGLRAAVRYVRISRLGRWLLLSALGMVVAQFVAQYAYSDVFARVYPDPGELAVFLSVYLALSNLVEIALGLWVTPWLIRRFGVGGAFVVHPMLMLASFGGLFASARLDTALAARANRELVDNAVAQPVRTLVFNALPPRFRGRIRAFLEGIVVYLGMSAAGLLLLALHSPDPSALALIGALASILYFASSSGARRAYLDTLIDGIRTGRLDLADLDRVIGDWEAASLAELCDELLRAEALRPSRSLLQLIASLGQHGIAEPLVRGLAHPLAAVRAACARALAGNEDARAALAGALRDPDPAVRLTALEALSDAATSADIAPLSNDPDARVRAAAAALSPATWGALEQMLESDDRDTRLAALAAAGAAQAQQIARSIDDVDPRVRAAALERLAAVARDRIPAGAIARALGADDARVRRAALRAAAGDSADCVLVAEALRDPQLLVRERAAEALAASGAAGVEAALPFVRDESESVASAALAAVSAGDHPRRGAFLAAELRRWVALSWSEQVGLGFIERSGATRARFLRLAVIDGLLRHRRLAFLALAAIESPRVVRRVERALRFGSARSRGDALEVLSNLGDRTAARVLVVMHEPGRVEERAASLGSAVPVPKSREAFLAELRRSSDRWLQIALAAGGDALSETPDGAIMERLLALKRVPLFENLSLDQLDALQQFAREASFLPGEVVVREGDTGGELFLLLEGSAEAWLDYRGPQQRRLSVIDAGGYFGEMAILDDAPRSATVIALAPLRLLALDGDSLKALLRQMPDVALELLRVMTGRVRASERRLLAER